MAGKVLALAAALQATWMRVAEANIAACPGEGDRYGDHRCNHDPTHRFCAQLLDGDGQPLSWGPKGDFWEITGQKAFQWDDTIRENNGDSWCICMWAAARLISEAGCDNVHLRCEASDIDYILQQYTDGGVDLEPAKNCLQQKCPSSGVVQENDATAPRLEAGPRSTGLVRFTAPAAVLTSLTAAGVLLWRMRASSASRCAEGADVAMAGIE
uniref:Cellulase n=1 Tax=Alexandrium monilatum TaxID=311494 RepID=A0A7S4VNI5_9DINO